MFEFTGLKILHQDMKNVGETRAVFTFQYNQKKFSCIFLVDITPFRLYLTTLGAIPLVIELEIDEWYKVKSCLDKYDYKKLVEYLDLKYDPKHKFIPNDFFEALNKKIPQKFTESPSYIDVLRIASKKRNIEETEKTYFCGWYSNPTGKNVRPENLEKTRSAFGDEIANISKTKNISSCWTNVVKDEQMKALDDIYSK